MFSFTTISILDKSDGDSMASKREAVAKAERAFKIFDKDNDGFITKEEFQKISKKLNKEQVQKLLVHLKIRWLGNSVSTRPASVSDSQLKTD